MAVGTDVPPRLVARSDPGPARRVLRSATATSAAAGDVLGWLARRARRHDFRVHRISFPELDHWHFEEGTGNLQHRTGGFFTVTGLDVTTDGSADQGPRHWQQPVIAQPEVGVLGLLAKEFDGVLHFLLQAKMEPGNPNQIQLSPTVQATRSNYTRLHAGGEVRYLEHFLTPGRGRVLGDVLQSEQGSWFFRKLNRNIIVETREEVPTHEDFRWLTLADIGRLLRQDLLVNMDVRSVLASAPLPSDEAAALHPDTEVLSWFAAERSARRIDARRIPLAEVRGWGRDDWMIRHEHDRFFRVVAVSVEAGSREVARWTQPLVEPVRGGIAAFVVRRFAGVPHLLVKARVEGGFINTVELGPTVQCAPGSDAECGSTCSPFRNLVLNAGADRIRYSALQSEEGGRFLNAENRYLVVEADEREAPTRPPAHHFWVTPSQLRSLVRHSNYVTVQARTLLAAINSRAVVL